VNCEQYRLILHVSRTLCVMCMDAEDRLDGRSFF